MFRRHEITLMSNPSCVRPVDSIDKSDFNYFDKDGFELNKAEQEFYRAMKFPIDHGILNHCCWQEPWFELEKNTDGLLLDHCMFLCRSNYSADAEEQLKQLRDQIPQADMLLRTKQKWGFDFALDAVADDCTVFEVLHIEYDSYNYDNFKNRMLILEWTIRHTDWRDAAKRIWAARSEWENLQGFEQNHWKSRFLLNWNKAEYTEKSI